MVSKSPTSWVVYLLSLLRIIPSIKSSVLNKAGLFIWMSVSLGSATAYLFADMDAHTSLVKQYSVYNLLYIGSGTWIPLIQVMAAFPALHYLGSVYEHILRDPYLACPKKPWLFLTNAILCVSDLVMMIILSVPHLSGLQSLALVSFCILLCSLRLISSFTIGICTAQMTARLKNNDANLLFLDCSSEILQEFISLKKGLSPLLFLMFSTQCLILIVNSASLLIKPNYGFGVTSAYTMMDLIYSTFVIDHTYESFKDMSLGLK